MLKISFIFYIFAEIFCVAIYMANYGILSFFGELFLSAIFGFLLIAGNGIGGFYSNFAGLNLQSIFGSMGFVFGGILLVLPGILCDILGVFVILISIILKFLAPSSKPNFSQKGDDIIDVEIIDEKRG